MADIGRIDAVQDQVHHAQHVGQRFLLLAVEGLALQRVPLGGGEVVAAQVVPCLAQEPGRTAGAVINGLADLRLHHLDHGADQRARRVVLAAIATGVAHALDAGFVQVGQLVLGVLAAEVELVDDLQCVAQRVARAKAVGDLGEDLADLVFQRVRIVRGVAKGLQVGKQLAVDELDQVLAGARGIEVRRAVLVAGCGPGLPAVGRVEDGRVLAPLQLCLVGPLLLHVVEVLEKQQPRGLLGVIQLRSQPLVVAHDAIEVVEGVFKHAVFNFLVGSRPGRSRS